MIFSWKFKIFSKFFSPFLKFTSNFDNFEKKISLMGDLFPKLLKAKDVAKEMPKKTRVRTLMESQHVKGSKTLSKSTGQ